MDKRKDIGDAFREKFNNFEQAPSNPDRIWDSIAAEINSNDDDDKAFPFWLKTGALILFIGSFIAVGTYFIISNNSSIPSENNTITVDNTEDNSSITTNETNGNLNSDNAVSNSTIPVNTNNSEEDTIENETTNAQNSVSNSTTITNSNEETTTSNQTLNSQNSVSNVTTNSSYKNNNTTTGVSKNTNNNTTSSKTNSTRFNNTKENNSNKTSSAITNSNYSSTQNSNISYTTKTEDTDTNIKSRSEKIIQTFKNNDVESVKFSIASRKFNIANSLKTISYKKSNYLKKLERDLLKAERKAERELFKKEVKNYEWTIGPVIAPTVYGSLTKSSLLDARLDNNPRKGESNLSFGLKVDRRLSENSKLRFGVNKINLGYLTQNFQVNIIDDVVNIYQLNGIDAFNEVTAGGIPLNPDATAFFNENDVVSINQDISYLEFPVEFEYSFINNRFASSLIGGTSLIVLNKNEIFAVSNNGQSLRVGESNNLSGLGFTLNVGLGFEYEISKSLQFSVDPIFKLQLNSSKDGSVNNFKPYYFGIYSGLSFKF